MRTPLIILSLALLSLTACNQQASEDQVNTAVAAAFTEQAANFTPTPSLTPTEVPSATPTSTPSPTSTPVFALFTAQDVIDQLVAAGLPVGDYRTMTPDDYGIAPLRGEGIRFFIASLGANSGGRVLSFATQEDLLLLKEYYDRLGQQSAALFSWVFVHHNALIQINGHLPESQALEYKAALESLAP